MSHTQAVYTLWGLLHTNTGHVTMCAIMTHMHESLIKLYAITLGRFLAISGCRQKKTLYRPLSVSINTRSFVLLIA